MALTQAFTTAITPPYTDYAGACMALSYNGAGAFAIQRTPDVFKNLNALATNAEITAWTPATGKKFRIMGGFLTVGVAAGSIILRDNTSGTTIAIIPPMTIAVSFAWVLPGNGIISATANNVLTMQGAATSTVTGMIWGTEE